MTRILQGGTAFEGMEKSVLRTAGGHPANTHDHLLSQPPGHREPWTQPEQQPFKGPEAGTEALREQRGQGPGARAGDTGREAGAWRSRQQVSDPPP